jgi:hypothetical protein
MMSCARSIAASLILLVSAIAPAFAGEKPQTLTGQVSDSMCGAKHAMQGSAADCTHACVKQGSAYALVVKDKVYTIETTDKAVLDALDHLAGANAQVTGTLKGDTLTATSAAAAK